MTRMILALAALLLVAGPVALMLGAPLGAGVLVFSAGVIVLGAHTLLTAEDRAIGWVLVLIGAVSTAAYVVRLLLTAG